MSSAWWRARRSWLTLRSCARGESSTARSRTIGVTPFLALSSSEVFKAQLQGGLRESEEKRIVVDDIDAVTFRVLLKFLYTE